MTGFIRTAGRADKSQYYLTCRIDTDSCIDRGEDLSCLTIIYNREDRIVDRIWQLYQVDRLCTHFA